MYTILGTDYCTYCMKAKMLLNYYNVPYKFLDINQEMYYKEYLIPGVKNHRTIPKVIYKNKFIGGYNELEDHLIKNLKRKKRNSNKKKRKKTKRKQ